jgi:MFS family permease
MNLATAIRNVFVPKPTISDEEVAGGLRWLTREGIVSLGFGSITTSGFLAAFALLLGANNLQIGILAALPFLGQILQVPTIGLVEKFRRRKAIAVTVWLLAQLLWLPVALIPFYLSVPSAGAISALLVVIAVRAALNGVTNGAWNSWIRDLVPQRILGTFFARRLMLANVAAMVFGLSAALFADYWVGHNPGESAAYGYAYPLLAGALLLGLASPVFMSMMPEPLMQRPVGPQPSLLSAIATPIRDGNYRRLVVFLFLWGLALNLAIPFFAVYMLQRLGLPVSAVIGFSILSQASNVVFLRMWGPLADRFGMKAVLTACASLYLLVILGWTFTSMPERYALTIPLLVVLHIFAGAAAAGVSLTIGTIGMKLAPQGRATAYLAVAGLAANLGYGLGPLLGGRFADFFSVRQLSLSLTWVDPTHSVQLPALSLTGFDFLFGVAFLVGVLTLYILATVREEGEVSREVVMDALMAPMRQMGRPMSTTPGLNFLTQFPFGYLRRMPLPGMDVALGITTHQLAEAVRLAIVGTARGRRTTARMAKALEGVVNGAWRSTHPDRIHSTEVAQHAARGAMHAAKETELTERQLARQAVRGVLRGMRQPGVDPADVLRGIGYGVVQGAHETQADVGEAVAEALEAAEREAVHIGVSEEETVVHLAQGAVEAGIALGPQAMAEVAASMPEKVAEQAVAMTSDEEAEHPPGSEGARGAQ